MTFVEDKTVSPSSGNLSRIKIRDNNFCGYGGIGRFFAERCRWQIQRGKNCAAVFFDLRKMVPQAVSRARMPCTNLIYADMAELADAHGSGPCESNFMEVQVLLSAPNSRNPNLVPIGEGFGFLLYLDYPNFNSKLK